MNHSEDQMSPSEQHLSPAKQRLLARLLQDRDAQPASRQWGSADAYVVPLRTSGAKQPLFIIHPIMGVAFPYYALVMALDPDRPVFGLQSFDNRGDALQDWKMERIVARYVAEVRKVQPTGPYHLAGWSFGSMAAYEMACQLAEAGEEVRSLIVLDTWAPGSGSVFDYLSFGWSVCRDIWPYVSQYGRLRKAQNRVGATRLPNLWPLFDTYWRNMLAVMLYRPSKTFAGGLSLVRTIKTPDAELKQPDWGWKRFARAGVDVQTMIGNHMAILTAPQVDTVATEMNRFLAE